jgi:cephalosporin hydroxylase
MFDRDAFEAEKRRSAAAQAQDAGLQRVARDFVIESDRHGYAYQWTWMGLPVIQLPQDLFIMQELVHAVRPTVVVETGVAWGGSIAYLAGLLELLGQGTVVGVDVVLPQKNRDLIRAAPGGERAVLIEGSSVAEPVLDQVRAHIGPEDRVMVFLDSNHTHDHVLAELRAYSGLVTEGSYLIVGDTIVENIPAQTHRPRPWGPGANPMTAMRTWLAETDRFELDDYYNAKGLLSFNPDGFLRCVKP